MIKKNLILKGQCLTHLCSERVPAISLVGSAGGRRTTGAAPAAATGRGGSGAGGGREASGAAGRAGGGGGAVGIGDAAAAGGGGPAAAGGGGGGGGISTAGGAAASFLGAGGAAPPPPPPTCKQYSTVFKYRNQFTYATTPFSTVPVLKTENKTRITVRSILGGPCGSICQGSGLDIVKLLPTPSMRSFFPRDTVDLYSIPPPAAD
jgi:hypothetical protein